ncbi:restriction endonuclease [Actinoplanes awajinensis subsp. mycoplanecinus]|uniref:Restriction endonuclease n=1 Tax=Actinoplanes awajinensis subsp. mycoplanecinus TaxID=135947 RepID=A0A101JR11_9ACTN|nr:restriction endonuclease [Actinoplanes awajinensis]KUL31440.1 restriction endonuclease [Actinoplanes awajinensis subsp. mycoplanecinus]
MAVIDLPRPSELLVPTLRAMRELGGSASINEIVETVVQREGFSDQQQSQLHNQGPQTEVGYRLAWTRTRLKLMGLLTNSSRGVWALTDEGAALVNDSALPDELQRERIHDRWIAYVGELRAGPGKRRTLGDDDAEPITPEESDEASEVRGWKEHLLHELMAMTPDGFERLAQRLLREANFDSVAVTGKSGDGGIDGLGVYRLGLVSFPIFFQCKRYQGTVGSGAVRDFRGAMAGRGDKGLLITTGSFSADATKEANRAGAQPIDLIDGDHLCDLLKTYELGIRVETRTVEDVTVQPGFFADM